jgi:hypothetical protein
MTLYEMFVLPFAYVLGGAAVGTGIYAAILFSRARATLRWKPGEGEITTSLVEERKKPWYAMGRRRRRHLDGIFSAGDLDIVPEGQFTDRRADIRYVYAVGGRNHEARCVYFGAHRWSPDQQVARSLVARYPVGTQVRVYYNPAKPDAAVLVRGETRMAKSWLIVAAVLAVAAALIVAFR